jgi:hypothetical protein
MQLNKEISEAIATVNPADATEEDELEEMLADLEQEALDTKMISAPSVPSVPIQGQAVRPGELWCLVHSLRVHVLTSCSCCQTAGGGRRRGAAEAASRNGDVICYRSGMLSLDETHMTRYNPRISNAKLRAAAAAVVIERNCDGGLGLLLFCSHYCNHTYVYRCFLG